MFTRTKLVIALAAVSLAACTTVDAPPPPNTLVVAKAATAPTLDGNATRRGVGIGEDR